MTARKPLHNTGDTIDTIDTPALAVDLDRLQANIAKLAAYAAEKGVAVRPHFKTHKCLAIAHLQIAAGATGLCCQKVSEAEILVAGGITDVLVTNEVFVPSKLERLVELSARAQIGICIDSPEGLENLQTACHKSANPINVYIEVELGTVRSGVETPEEVLALAKLVTEGTNMRFAGLQAYYGRAQHIRSAEERAHAIADAISRVKEITALLDRHNIQTKTITGGGTGTFTLEASSGIYTEIQPGSYVFMDHDYSINQPAPDAPVFENSLFIFSTVHSRRANRAVIDAGHKAHTVDCGMPAVYGRPDLAYVRPADEHGSIVSVNGGLLPDLGEYIRLVPGHCDPTVNLYDWLIVFRGSTVADVWPIEGRGAVS